MGSSVIARTMLRPGYETRACTHANGTPNTTAIAVAATDVSSESRNAVRASTLDTTFHDDDHGARHTSPTSGTTKNNAARAAPTITMAGTRDAERRARAVAAGGLTFSSAAGSPSPAGPAVRSRRRSHRRT